ncbi:MAG: 23S rRNA pseudouridine(1911/1915/1917) synthase RluD [Betaproteobacteria bacterium]
MPDYIENTPEDRNHSLAVPADFAGLRLDQALARLLPEYSRNRLQEWMRTGHVTLDGNAAAAKTKVWGGERIVVTPQASPSTERHDPEDIPLHVVYEDADILVIDKPAGLVVHPGSGNWSGTMLNALLRHAPSLSGIPRAGIVHRLDKDTSGLLVVAKTIQAQVDLVRQLQARSVTREYVAVVHGVVNRDGAVDAPIGRHPVQRTRMAVVATGKPARTFYFVEETGEGWSRLRCRLESGRTHQIRVHLGSIGHALIGDPVYGGAPRKAMPLFHRQALHAAKLALVHPSAASTMHWEAPLPADLVDLLEKLRHAAPA